MVDVEPCYSNPADISLSFSNPGADFGNFLLPLAWLMLDLVFLTRHISAFVFLNRGADFGNLLLPLTRLMLDLVFLTRLMSAFVFYPGG